MNLSNFITKKSVFLASLIGTALFFLPFSSDAYSYCFQQGYCWRLWDFFELAISYLLFFPAILVVSFFLFLAREEVFRAWVRFAYWWIPVSIVLIYLAKDSSGGGFGIPAVLDQESVSFILAALFALISLLIIAWKYVASLPKY